MLRKKPAFRWIHNVMKQLNTEIACIKLGRVNVITVSSPELSIEFLKKHNSVIASRPDVSSARLVSNGYLSPSLSPSGNQWTKMRRVLVSEVFDLDGNKKMITDAIKNVRKYHDQAIEKRMEMWKLGLKSEDNDILGILINLKNSQNRPLLSIREIKAVILEMMLATIDNPSNAVKWTMAEMINQPDILAKACEELDRVIGKNRLVQESDLSKLNYVKACLKESFRIHPDEPLRFKPERHIVDEVSNVSLVDHDLRILSFSTGRQGCPALELGSTTTTILLARLIQGFSWKQPLDTSTINLAESKHDLSLAKPLIAHAVPQLDSQIYLQHV
ncbi:hypothetical protein SASPL_141565 [Salvia splendens]|uniref:Phenylalanine N-monooxygenase n=1 Tax=Salvia splendens TaxID=180675 RepID=A0A8X8ZCG0_SALSN|nr:hypothetical protein SASPL_141565 [Salvia splendens]